MESFYATHWIGQVDLRAGLDVLAKRSEILIININWSFWQIEHVNEIHITLTNSIALWLRTSMY
jgi:hypothetical protein